MQVSTDRGVLRIRSEYLLLLISIMNVYRSNIGGNVTLQHDNGERYLVHLRNNIAFRIIRGDDSGDEAYCYIARMRYNEYCGGNCTLSSDVQFHEGITLPAFSRGARATMVSEFPIPIDYIERALNTI
ncbi:hypothetical protein DFH28DRAFT_1131090 [Melampsora americana]|nr:hypothetical protein DFH28DRAFT_1131090 [Melampsora americana]